MALNKTILSKLAEKTSEDRDIQAFLTGIFQFESVPGGWYKRVYDELLEAHCIETEEAGQ